MLDIFSILSGVTFHPAFLDRGIFNFENIYHDANTENLWR